MPNISWSSFALGVIAGAIAMHYMRQRAAKSATAGN